MRVILVSQFFGNDTEILGSMITGAKRSGMRQWCAFTLFICKSNIIEHVCSSKYVVITSPGNVHVAALIRIRVEQSQMNTTTCTQASLGSQNEVATRETLDKLYIHMCGC